MVSLPVFTHTHTHKSVCGWLSYWHVNSLSSFSSLPPFNWCVTLFSFSRMWVKFLREREEESWQELIGRVGRRSSGVLWRHDDGGGVWRHPNWTLEATTITSLESVHLSLAHHWHKRGMSSSLSTSIHVPAIFQKKEKKERKTKEEEREPSQSRRHAHTKGPGSPSPAPTLDSSSRHRVTSHCPRLMLMCHLIFFLVPPSSQPFEGCLKNCMV